MNTYCHQFFASIECPASQFSSDTKYLGVSVKLDYKFLGSHDPASGDKIY